jgi:hypothetical protein
VSGNVILMSPPSAKWICGSIQKIRNWDFDKISMKKFSWDEMTNKIEKLYRN